MQKSIFSGLKLDNGEPIYTQEYIQSLRDSDKKHPDKLKIIALSMSFRILNTWIIRRRSGGLSVRGARIMKSAKRS